MIEAATGFIKAFIKEEYEALVSQYTERNSEIFQGKLEKLKKFYAPGILPDVNRSPFTSERWFEEGKKTVESVLAPRVLFQVKEYEHPTLGKIYRCYVSNTTTARNNQHSYFANFYLTDRKDGLKIVAKYHIDREITNLDGGLEGWNNRGGIELETLGKLNEVRKFQEPSDPKHLAEYQAE